MNAFMEFLVAIRRSSRNLVIRARLAKGREEEILVSAAADRQKKAPLVAVLH
ncbi:hypothetical protein NUITMVR1_09790 [Raoultella ornithinolytica]|nr:hypothetical protein NUITMVR1_09790 [Raoultella ornithinolytica]